MTRRFLSGTSKNEDGTYNANVIIRTDAQRRRGMGEFEESLQGQKPYATEAEALKAADKWAKRVREARRG